MKEADKNEKIECFKTFDNINILSLNAQPEIQILDGL